MRVGIEIEVESESMSIAQASRILHSEYSRWVCEHDGSLRGGSMGFEIKSACPTDIAEVPAALTQLYPVLAGSTGSWRAAVHVHVDMTKLYWNKKALALALAYTLDLPLFNRYSPERVESNFSVPLSHKQYGVFECIRNMIECDEIVRYGKYSSVNIGRINDLGTLEFRHMRTPACGQTVDSVRDALAQVQDFAESCSAIVDNVSHVKIRSDVGLGNELARAFIQCVEHMDVYNHGRRWMVPSELAIGEVLPVLDNVRGYDITTLDLGSIIQAVPVPVGTLRGMRNRVGLRESLEEIDNDMYAEIFNDIEIGGEQ